MACPQLPKQGDLIHQMHRRPSLDSQLAHGGPLSEIDIVSLIRNS